MLLFVYNLVIIVKQAEMNVLHKTQADLVKGKEKLEVMVKELENEKVTLIWQSRWPESLTY